MRKKREKVTLESLKRLARERGGECLSESFSTVHQNYRWRCANGHEWSATAHSVRGGSWCAIDYGLRRGKSSKKYNIEFFRNLARQHGGECLSEEYFSKTPMHFRCSNGHEFKMTRDKLISRHSWCPACKSNRMEEVCRTIYELGFALGFPRKNPGFMMNEGRRLQLDGYSETLGLAFEYQGEQHFSSKTLFGGEAELARRQVLDARKLELCAAAGVVLVQIPTMPKGMTMNRIIEHVVDTIPASRASLFNRARISAADFDSTRFDVIKEKVLKLIQEKGGTLLSVAVPSVTTKIEVACPNGHVFSTTGHRLSQGKWCRFCSINLEVPEDEMVRLIEAKGGTFIRRFHTKPPSTPATWIELSCSRGHVWKTRQATLRGGSWCGKCNYIRDEERVAAAGRLAGERGGACLSSRCDSVLTKIVWRCGEGHRFKASINEVRTLQYWCPACAGSSRRMKWMAG